MSETKPKRYWTGTPPARCDLTDLVKGKHNISNEFIDGKTTMGPWAIMCAACHKAKGVGLGTGKGQHYRIDGNGNFAKVGG